jgi:hypothetical protein
MMLLLLLLLHLRCCASRLWCAAGAALCFTLPVLGPVLLLLLLLLLHQYHTQKQMADADGW